MADSLYTDKTARPRSKTSTDKKAKEMALEELTSPHLHCSPYSSMARIQCHAGKEKRKASIVSHSGFVGRQ